MHEQCMFALVIYSKTSTRVNYKKAQLAQGFMRDSAVIPRWQLFQDGRHPPYWILSNRK